MLPRAREIWDAASGLGLVAAAPGALCLRLVRSTDSGSAFLLRGRVDAVCNRRGTRFLLLTYDRFFVAWGAEGCSEGQAIGPWAELAFEADGDIRLAAGVDGALV